MSRKTFLFVALLVLGAFLSCGAFAEEPTSAAPAGDLKESMSLAEVFKAGGVLMYPISLMSLAGVALIVYFFIVLRPGQVVPDEWFSHMRRELSSRRLDEARALCSAKPSPIASVASAAIDYVQGAGQPDTGMLKEIMQGEGVRQATRLQNQIQYLLDIAVITPMIGLLGTVVGMLQAFNAVALDIAKAKPMLLAAGVSLALITTAAGLIVAIPAMAFYAYFRNRTSGLVARLETAAADLLALLAR